MAGKWSTYATRYGQWLGSLFNQDMRRVLKAGVTVLIRNTHQDSGLAAYHWVIVPSKGRVAPGRWSQSTFNRVYGRSPVGHKGDRGRNAERVIKAVVEREWSRSIKKAVSGRNPATSFKFRNTVYDVHEKYADNANLKEAERAALSVMKRKHAAQISRGNFRKNPLV